MTIEQPRMLTRAEAVAMLGMSREGLARIIRRGKLSEYRYGPRQSRVAEADLVTFMESKRSDRR